MTETLKGSTMEEEENVEYESVADIPIPKDLPPEKYAEFVVFRECLIMLETEWLENQEFANGIQKAAHQELAAQEEERLQNLEDFIEDREYTSELQFDKKIEELKMDYEEHRKIMFKSILRQLGSSYKVIMKRLKELMGKDFPSFFETHKIDFPEFIADPCEEFKVKIKSSEASRELKNINDKFKDYNQVLLIQNVLENFGSIQNYTKEILKTDEYDRDDYYDYDTESSSI